MIRPFVPPAVAALRPIIVMQGDDELVQARDAGFAEGHALGLLEGRLAGQREGAARARDEVQAELDALREQSATMEATGTVAMALDRLLAARQETDRALEATAREVLVSALRTLFPALLASAAGAEVAEIVREALCVRAPEPLSLRAHPDTLACLAGEAPEGLALVPDATRDPGAAELTWSGGGLTFDPATLLERVEAVLCPTPADTQETAP
jgi:hypothetical protein